MTHTNQNNYEKNSINKIVEHLTIILPSHPEDFKSLFDQSHSLCNTYVLFNNRVAYQKDDKIYLEIFERDKTRYPNKEEN